MKRIFSLLASVFIAMLLLLPTAVRAESDEYISDTYGVLNEAELEALNEKARALSDKYEFGVYAHILFDNESYDDIWGFAEKYWNEMDLGYGNTGDGILFIIAQSDRGGSYNIYVPATSNQAYFTVEALDDIESHAEQGLFDHNYFKAVNAFLDQTEQKLDFYTKNGYAWPGNTSMNSPVVNGNRESPNQEKMLATFCVPPIIALIVVIIRASKHKTRRLATTAGAYIAPYGQLQLTSRTDMFLHRTRSRVRVRSDNSSSSGGSSGGGGGGRSSSGGMHSGGGHF